MRQGKLSELIHNSANFPDLDECSVEVHFREIVDLVRIRTGVLYLINRFPWYKRKAMIAGVVCCVAGLLGAAFANAPGQLMLTQGVIFSLGGGDC